MRKLMKLSLITCLLGLGFQSQAIEMSDKPIQLNNSKSSSVGQSRPSFGGTALVIDDGTVEGEIGDDGQFIWINRFTPAPGDFPFQLEDVSVVFNSANVNIGGNIEILIYEDTDGDGDPGTGATLLASFSETIQNNDNVTFNVYSLATPVDLVGPGDVLIGIVNKDSFEGAADFPASIDQTATQGRSWVGSYSAGDVPANPSLPADEQWGTIDSFELPGNWMVRGAGTPIPVELMNFSVE